MKKIFHMILVVGLSSAAAWASDAPMDPPPEDPNIPLNINIGRPWARKHLGFGWASNERSKATRFCWMNKLEADVWFEVTEPDTGRIFIKAMPYYIGRKQQRMALYINNKFIKSWICRHNKTWRFEKYAATIPADALREGENRLTLRTAYLAKGKKRYHSLAVDHILIRLRDDENTEAAEGEIHDAENQD